MIVAQDEGGRRGIGERIELAPDRAVFLGGRLRRRRAGHRRQEPVDQQVGLALERRRIVGRNVDRSGSGMAVQRYQRVGRQPVQRVLVRAFGQPAGEGRVAEILNDEEAAFRVFGMDRRCAEAEVAEMAGDPDEGRDFLLRRRRIHQQGRGRPAGEAEIAPEGGVAGERRHARLPPVRVGEESMARPIPGIVFPSGGITLRQPVQQGVQPVRCTRAVVYGNAPQQGVAGVVEADVDAPVRQQGAGALGPFDQADAAGERLLEADLPQLLRCSDAVQVDMPDRVVAETVELDEGEGRARHLFGRAALALGVAADEMPGEGRLAGAERSAQGDHVAALGTGRKRLRQRFEIPFGNRRGACRPVAVRGRIGRRNAGVAQGKPVVVHGTDAYWSRRLLSSCRDPLPPCRPSPAGQPEQLPPPRTQKRAQWGWLSGTAPDASASDRPRMKSSS